MNRASSFGQETDEEPGNQRPSSNSQNSGTLEVGFTWRSGAGDWKVTAPGGPLTGAMLRPALVERDEPRADRLGQIPKCGRNNGDALALARPEIWRRRAPDDAEIALAEGIRRRFGIHQAAADHHELRVERHGQRRDVQPQRTRLE